MALIEKLDAIGSAIRAKTGKTAKMTLDEMPSEIASIETGGANNYAKFTATTDSSISFIIENPLGGIAKKVSIKAISPTITSSRKIHECCLDWDVKLGAVKAYYTSGNVTYAMVGIEGTPNNGQFRMTESFITAYRFNSATSWDTTCEYEIEIYQ